jgi:hypothetical protein
VPHRDPKAESEQGPRKDERRKKEKNKRNDIHTEVREQAKVENE